MLKVEEVNLSQEEVLSVAVYAVPARITQGVWMEFQKRLYYAQEDIILNERRKEAYEAANRVDSNTRQEILQKWRDLRVERIPRESKERK
jgi:hypothetical protein